MLDVSADQGTFTRRIRLLIADRQPIVLQGLRSLFAAQHDFEIVASCSRGKSCLDAIRNLAPDVALVANTLPDLTVSEILTIAKAENLPTRLVFFAESEGDHDLTAAIAAGACSAISKYANPDTILRSLRLMTERISARPKPCHGLSPNVKEVDGAKIEKLLKVLTRREREIMRLVAEGLSNKEIARHLNVSRGTVKVHLYNIFQKLEISNRTVLATIAQRSAGFGALSLAAFAYAILSDLKASHASSTLLDDNSTEGKDLEHSVFEFLKKAILRNADPSETVLINQTGSPPAQRFPPLEFAWNPIKSHGGYGAFSMTAAGVGIYTLDNSHAAVQALDPGKTLIDTSTVATTQIAILTIHGASHVDPNDVDNPAWGPVVHDSRLPLAFGHDGVAGSQAPIIHGVAGDDTLNGAGLLDVIYGGSGNDTNKGTAGDDTIYGESGSDTINGNKSNDSIIGGYDGDQLTGSKAGDIFVYLSAKDSNSTQFDTIIDFTSGEDKINLAAFGALAFLHLTSAGKSVPPHTLAWIYNHASNETIVYVNPTDRSLDIGDPGLLEIHLQGVVSVAELDFVHEQEGAAVAAALEGIDPALLVATASDGTILMAGTALASIEAAASESEHVTAGVWTMPADDGLRFHFGRDRVGSDVPSRLTNFGDDPTYATESDDGVVTVPVHVSSIELAHSQATLLTEETLTFKNEPAHSGAPATGNGHAPATAGFEFLEFGTQSAAAVAVAETVGSHVNSQHASHSATAKESAAGELTEPGVTSGNGVGHNNSHSSHSASASTIEAAEAVEPDVASGNGGGHGNSKHPSHSAAAKESAALPQPAEAARTGGSGHEPAFHFKNQAPPSTPTAAGELEGLNDSPALLLNGVEPAAILEMGPAATEEHATSHDSNGQHHSLAHSPHELLT